MEYTIDGSSKLFENILINVLKIPGVKVEREEFLAEILKKYVKNKGLVDLAIKTTPFEAGLDAKEIHYIAKKLINDRTKSTSMISFAAGLPGGLAMAATIPADTMQYFAAVVRLTQELAYLYGYESFWKDNSSAKKVNEMLVLFLGVMFGIGGVNHILKLLLPRFAKAALIVPEKVMLNSLTKRVAAIIGVKLTSGGLTKGVSKAVPILGGVVSGGITFYSMKKMGSRLNDELRDYFLNYTEADYIRDMRNIGDVVWEVACDDVKFVDDEVK